MLSKQFVTGTALATTFLLAACSARTDTAADAGSTDDAGQPDAGAGCAQLSGVYYFDTGSSCTGGYTALSFACAMQTGCDLTLVTDGAAFGGPVTGNTFSVTNTALQETCNGTIDSNGHSTINCTAEGGAITCALKATPGVPPEGYENVCCDLTSPATCSGGAVCRPGLLDTGSSANLCYQATGTVGLGESCTRSGAGLSKDDCKAPYACSRNGAPAGGLVCDAVCTVPSDCGPGQHCQRITEGVPAGLCVPACQDPFGSTSSCGTGQKCSAIDSMEADGTYAAEFVCFQVGSGQVNDICSNTSDCAQGLACASGFCAPYCDFSHTCQASGASCSSWNDSPPNDPSFGTCQ